MAEIANSNTENNNDKTGDLTESPKNALIHNYHSVIFNNEANYSEGEEPVTNPEMPQNVVDQDVENGDTIKGTVFSKHWTISVLLDFVKYIQSKELYEKPDIEDRFHENLCKLWDISINEEVSVFLLENEFLDLFTTCVERSACSRAIEISIGILANMSYVGVICEAIEKDPQIMKLIMFLLQSCSPPVLMETSRLLTTCISRSKSVAKWMDEIRESLDVYGCVLFIIRSSTNSQLLEGIAELIDVTFVSDDNIRLNWSTSEFVGGIVEALAQLRTNIGESGRTYLKILQHISTSEAGVQALVSHADKICKFSIYYLKTISDEDFIVLDDKKVTVASALAILNATFCYWEARRHFLLQESMLIRCILKLTEVSSRNGKIDKDGNEITDESALTEYISEILLSLLHDILATLMHATLDSLQLDKEELIIPKSLEYLETTCNSDQLSLFVKSLTNHDLWLKIVRSFDCTRLIDYLNSDIKTALMYSDG